jgi:hypothetical protein
VKGSILGNETADGTTLVVISARGQVLLAPAATSDLAIGSLTVGGSIHLPTCSQDSIKTTRLHWKQWQRFDRPVKVGGNWVRQQSHRRRAGWWPARFCHAGDTVINNPAGAATDAIVARIASITIKGLVSVPPPMGVSSSLVLTAQQIGSFKSLGFKATLTNATDAAIPLSPTTGDMALREV